jgi:hypothetical protein
MDVLLINILVCALVAWVVYAVFFYRAERKNTKNREAYKETIKQVTDMLRSYKLEPDNNGQTGMANTMFSEMIQYVPEEDRNALKELYNQGR